MKYMDAFSMGVKLVAHTRDGEEEEDEKSKEVTLGKLREYIESLRRTSWALRDLGFNELGEYFFDYARGVEKAAVDGEPFHRVYFPGYISHIDTDGGSLIVTCVSKAMEITTSGKEREFSFKFAEKGKVSDNDSRLFGELFDVYSIITEDLTEEEDEEGKGQSMEEAEVSSAVAEVLDKQEYYIGEGVCTLELAKDGFVSPESVFSLFVPTIGFNTFAF